MVICFFSAFNDERLALVCLQYLLLISSVKILSIYNNSLTNIKKLILVLIPYIYALILLLIIPIETVWKKTDYLFILIINLIVITIHYSKKKKWLMLLFLKKKQKLDCLNFKIIVINIVQLIVFAILEEIVYRHIIQNSLNLFFKSYISVVLTAILFVFHHYFSFLYYNCSRNTFLELFFIGIIFGIVYSITGNLYLSILGHLLYNSPQIVINGIILLENTRVLEDEV